MAVSLALTCTGRLGLWFCGVFYVQEHPKAPTVVVLVLKRLRRQDHSLKSHSTDWEKPGIERAIPELQDIGLSPTSQRLQCFLFFLCPCSLAVPVLVGCVYASCGSMSRNSRRLNTNVVLVLKRLRRRGNGLKSRPTE